MRQRAFRYVYVKGADAELELSADHEYLPLTARGAFSCSEPLFDKIYSAAEYTFHLNAREALLDGIKRDRWVWSGDAFQSARINRYLYADKDIEQRTLIGLIGRSPIEQHINTIIDYSFLWIISLYEHYTTYGDVDFLRRIYPITRELLDFSEIRFNSDGFIEGIGDDWTFIDWSEIEKVGAISAEQMLMIGVYGAMAELSAALGLDASEFISKKDALTKRVNEFYWNEEKGAYIDSYATGNAHVTRHANIFAVIFGIADDRQSKSILKNVLMNDSINPITTPYFEGYELDALAILGEFDAVEEKLRSYWGGMIELGATTIWEEYDPAMHGIEHYAMYGNKYEKSLCHAWGANPIYLFGRYYLGVSPASAGYETFLVKPRLGGLENIDGSVPVKDGTVRVRFDGKELFVLSDVSGGALVFGGKEYPLEKNVPFVLSL